MTIKNIAEQKKKHSWELCSKNLNIYPTLSNSEELGDFLQQI